MKTPPELAEHPLADGQMMRIEATNDQLCVWIRDWREQLVCLRFHDVLGFEALSGSGELSHAGEDPQDPFLERAARAADEIPNEYRCIVLVEVDRDRPILRVVAKSLEVVAQDLV